MAAEQRYSTGGGPSTTHGEALVLMIHHLRLAQMYFENTNEKDHQGVREALRTAYAVDGEFDGEALAWLERLEAHYALLVLEQGE